MNQQIIIDFPILATALFMYFGMKGSYRLLCYLCTNHYSNWRSGYIAGHNALAKELRPKIDKLVENWEKIQAHDEKAAVSSVVKSTELHDCQVPGPE